MEAPRDPYSPIHKEQPITEVSLILIVLLLVVLIAVIWINPGGTDSDQQLDERNFWACMQWTDPDRVDPGLSSGSHNPQLCREMYPDAWERLKDALPSDVYQ